MITQVQAINGKAHAPGEISGPAFAIKVRLNNGSPSTINLDSAVATLTYGPDAKPGSPLSGKPSKPFSGNLAHGKSATGEYVFSVDSNGPAKLRIDLSYSPSAPAVVFVGRSH